MTLMNTLKQKSKKLAVGVALGGALLGAGCSKENTEEIKDNEAKMEQRADWKTEIKDARKKVGYLDEYLAAIERGENKDEAYRILTLKMADGNQKTAEEMQKQVEEVKKEVKGMSFSLISVGFLLPFLAFFMPKNYHLGDIDEHLGNVNEKLDKILKSKGVEK